MDLIALILYGSINALMAIRYLLHDDQYQYPFWVAVIALGWLFPQAVGLYSNREFLPPLSYSSGLLFASICTLALWWGYVGACKKVPQSPSWLDAVFDLSKLHIAGAVLCVCGFFFMWKLSQLPEEMRGESQWTGAPVKYLFLANIFKFGFISLWLIYLSLRKWGSPKLLVFIIPSLLLILNAALLLGRRKEMMSVVSYALVGLWFVRRIVLPRPLLICGLASGVILVNAIGIYRSIMTNREEGVGARLSRAANADYLQSAQRAGKSGAELKNYLYFRQAYEEEGIYDYGMVHWNKLIFNYVPAQIVGRGFKNALMLPLKDVTGIVRKKYGYIPFTGSTYTGYCDAFGSFGWFGFLKFILIGYIMGVLYRHANQGAFLAQLLYIYLLANGMQVVSHGTNDVLIRLWVFFFLLGYPVLRLAKKRNGMLSNNYG